MQGGRGRLGLGRHLFGEVGGEVASQPPERSEGNAAEKGAGGRHSLGLALRRSLELDRFSLPPSAGAAWASPLPPPLLRCLYPPPRTRSNGPCITHQVTSGAPHWCWGKTPLTTRRECRHAWHAPSPDPRANSS
jgi:hypothetical protein